jgi:hypothetical protein
LPALVLAAIVVLVMHTCPAQFFSFTTRPLGRGGSMLREHNEKRASGS